MWRLLCSCRIKLCQILAIILCEKVTALLFFCLKAATSANSLLTRSIVIQQEGIDEVLIDVLTGPRISIHTLHVFAECCHTAHWEKEKKEITFNTPYSVREKNPPQTWGLTWFGKLSRRSSWCWGRTGGLWVCQAGGASVWSETRAWWSLGPAGVPGSETETLPHERSPENRMPTLGSSTGGEAEALILVFLF